MELTEELKRQIMETGDGCILVIVIEGADDEQGDVSEKSRSEA